VYSSNSVKLLKFN